MDFLDLLRERLSNMLAEREGLNNQFEAILAKAAEEQRSDLNESEAGEIAALREAREKLTGDIADVEARIADIDANRRDSADAADKIKRFNIQRPSSVNNGVRGSDHTLDELLWATASEVRAGSLDNIGNVIPHMNARAAVERIEVRTPTSSRSWPPASASSPRPVRSPSATSSRPSPTCRCSAC